ncbi:hypothetical protein T05_7360, partial [Trichinella murrelli]
LKVKLQSQGFSLYVHKPSRFFIFSPLSIICISLLCNYRFNKVPIQSSYYAFGSFAKLRKFEKKEIDISKYTLSKYKVCVYPTLEKPLSCGCKLIKLISDNPKQKHLYKTTPSRPPIEAFAKIDTSVPVVREAAKVAALMLFFQFSQIY